MTGIRPGERFEKYENLLIATKRTFKNYRNQEMKGVNFYAPPNEYFDKIEVMFSRNAKNQRVVHIIETEINSKSVAENNKKLFKLLNAVLYNA